ncbi:conserved hypothetical protein [Altererythrobacter sp. B11]|uniref:glycosyltransferase family 4 protein n=1 Tax=Altererythrobacter sp. B11 TaxID=2060312 RepID=UPI000DC6DF17|nr:glycosyltransferase family 4 protein [Altererythrobacter sp. B11]BBC70948.1 conserved hypothetical protein [Altererythrobacter sp. B11]
MTTERLAETSSVMVLVSHSSAGGAQEIWANLAEGLAARGHQVTLAALYPYRATVRETADHLPWNYIVERRPTNILGMVRLVWALIRRLRRDRPKIVFTAMPAANVLASVCAALAGNGTKVVTSHHSPVQTHNPALDFVDGVAGSLPSVKAVVSVSNTVSDSLAGKSRAYRNKRITIHNALPPGVEDYIVGLAEAALPRPAANRIVVATGRLAEQKNYPLLIRAAGKLKDVTFNIVGDGPDREALLALRKEVGAEENVHFLGHRTRKEALAALAAGEVFAQVSLFEGHSLALVEAAKLGLPLIVSDVPVQIEGITAADGTLCGRSVGIADADGLARTIDSVLGDPEEYARLSQLSLKLGAEATFDAMIDAYERLLM